MKKAFTLIELLVVVLIIGILSAVALPQYQKAVQRARLSEILVRLNAMQKAVELYMLENGNPNFYSINLDEIYPDVFQGLSSGGDHKYLSKYVMYMPYCTFGNCQARAYFFPNGSASVNDTSGKDVRIVAEYLGSTKKWTYTCSYNPTVTENASVCEYFRQQGYSVDNSGIGY